MQRRAGFPSHIPILESLVVLVAVLALIASLAGLFWPGGDGAFTVTTYRGQEEEIFGRGLYRDSSTFTGAAARGTDVVTLLIGVPMLVAGTMLHRHGSVRGTLILAGALAWMLYAYASTSLGAIAYHDLFLLHVAIFGASLWTFIHLLSLVEGRRFGARLLPGMPQRGLGVFLIISGAVTAAIWLIEPVTALATGELPGSLGVSTTLFTNAFDIAIIVPAVVIVGTMVRTGRATGYVLAVPLLLLEAMLAPMIIAQTLFQLDAGIDFSPVQMVVMIGGFVLLAVIAIWMTLRVFQLIDDPAESHLVGHRQGKVVAR
jgi:hypothetical protein